MMIMMKALEHLFYKKRLGELGLLKMRRLRGKLMNVYQYLKGGSKENSARLFSLMPSGRTE